MNTQIQSSERSRKLESAKILAMANALIEIEVERLHKHIAEAIAGVEKEVIVNNLPNKGDRGKTGVSVTEAHLDGDDLVLEMDDGSVKNLGNIRGGPRGLLGPMGDRGTSGPIGETGERGFIGAIGPAGDKGEIGLIGETGELGDLGVAGIDGKDGDQGVEGEQGLVGEQGIQGLIGNIGEQGEQGPVGLPGPSGGVDGKDGKDGASPEIDFNLDDITEEINKRFIQLQMDVNSRITSIRALVGGGTGGSGSYSVLDQSDVVFKDIADVIADDLLVFDSTLSKFRVLNIAAIDKIITMQASIDAIGGTVPFTKLVDVANSTITYIGEAAAGSANSAILWRIQRVDTIGDPDTDILWANSQVTFVNEWDERANYVYG